MLSKSLFLKKVCLSFIDLKIAMRLSFILSGRVSISFANASLLDEVLHLRLNGLDF